MNSTDAFRRLRRADPAAAMPPKNEDDRERLLRAIVAAPLDPKAGARRRRLRPAALVFVGAAVLLLGGGAVYAKNILLAPITKGPNPPISAAQWRAEYVSWTQRIPLPVGAHWRGFRDFGNAGTSKGAGHEDAVFEALGHWSVEWLTATAVGDGTRAATAQDWVRRLRATIPTITNEDTAKAFHSTYGTEAMAGIDEAGARMIDEAIAGAQRRHFAGLVQAFAGYTYWPSHQLKDPGQAHEVAWDWKLDGKAPGGDGLGPTVSHAQSLAEVLGLARQVGVPSGLDLAGRVFSGVPPGVDPTLFPPGALALGSSPNHLGEAFRDAFETLWFAWWNEWVAAARAGDAQRVTAAEDATAKLESLLPATLSIDGHVALLDLVATPAGRDLRNVAARARAGDLNDMRAWLAFQRQYWMVRLEWASHDTYQHVCGGVLCPVSWIVAGDPSDLPQAGRDFERSAEREWLTCWRAWVAALSAGDTQKAAAEAQASAALRERMAAGWPTEGQAQVALSAATLQQFDRLAAQARGGDPSGLQDWLVYQVLYKTAVGKMALVGMTG